MNRVIVLVCLCSLASFPSPGEGGIFDGIIGGIIGKVIDIGEGITKQILKVVSPVLKIGHAIINPPLQAAEFVVNEADSLAGSGLNVSKGVLKNAMKIAGSLEGEFKAIEFPGKDLLALVFPRGVVSIVDAGAKTTVTIATDGLKLATDAAKATLAWTIYASLKVVFGGLDDVLMLMGDCFPLRAKTYKIKNNMLIDEIITSKGTLCGIGHITPVFNVSIGHDDEKILIVKIPLKIPHLVARYKFVNVPNYVDNEPLAAYIRKVDVEAKVTFRRGTILKFARLEIRVKNLQDFKLKFLDEKSSAIMEMVEAMSPRIGHDVKKELNKIFETLEEKLYDTIEGKRL